MIELLRPNHAQEKTTAASVAPIKRATGPGERSRGVGAERTCELAGNIEVELKGGYFGRLLEPVMAAVFQRIAPSPLAAFKCLVENGPPYQGRHSDLPAAAATC
jgi:hypothetical protein